MGTLFGGAFLIVIVILAVSIFLHFVPLGLWVSAISANVPVGIVSLIGMRLRRVPPSRIVLPLIKANKAGLDVSVNQLEAHYLAGGNVDKVVDALIASHRAQIALPFERAAYLCRLPFGYELLHRHCLYRERVRLLNIQLVITSR